MEGRVLLFNIHRITSDILNLEVESPGLLALAAFLETKGYDALVYQGEPSLARDFLGRQSKENIILAVGFYCDFENRTEVSEMSRFIASNYGLPVIFGGPQVSGMDAEYISNSKCTAAIAGEGEITLWRFLDCLCEQGGDWRELGGVVYVDESGTLIQKPCGNIVQNLDELPLPALHRWVNRPVRRKAHVLTGRGCPFNCAFCHEGSLSRSVRLRSVEHVLHEVETILDNEPYINYIVFADDTFTLSPERVKKLCEGLVRLRQKRDFIWYCEGHIKLLDKWPEMLADMVEAGMVRLQMGIESGVQSVLDKYNKGTTVPQIENVIKAAVDAGVHQIVGFFITGGPFESRETIERNKAFYERLIELAPGIIELGPSPLMPYPDTDIARCPGKYGIRILDPKGNTTFSDYPVTETEAMTREEIAKAQKELIAHGVGVMMRLFRQGKVPHERVLNCFRFHSYGAVSVWYTAIYSQVPFVHGYYTLLARGAVSRSDEIPENRIEEWRPQRTMEIWHDVDFSQGFPRIGRDVLSPLEFELLLYSTGKLCLCQVLDIVYDKFSGRIETRREFDDMARRILRSFEKKYWLVYAPL
ncbi:MAG: B12-binding domain-containing radical SAM protein [Clostridia bacterium]|nr:B12-binding domain-containing radical SAM protein [Clostridia bacterium]